MAYRYAISDPHGCLDVFERAVAALDLSGDNVLYLLGDYIPHQSFDEDTEEWLDRCIASLAFVRELQRTCGEHVVALLGNHEYMLLEQASWGHLELAPSLKRWLRDLRPFVETEHQIFVHAGVDEEAEDLWPWASEDSYFCSKVPPSFGHFEKDVIAGHVGAPGLAGDPDFEGAYWDGASHYYIDGTTERTGRMTILCYDVERGTYQQQVATAQGVGDLMPIQARA